MNKMQKCEYCGVANATSHCSKCKSVFYCSKNCQQKDWKGHKMFCIELVTTNDVPLMDMEEIAIEAWSSEAAHRTVQCSCKKCSHECVVLPGAYSPFQLLAEIKNNNDNNNNDKHIFSQVVQDYKVINGKAIFFLRPALEVEQKGQRAGTTQIGNCSNLGPNGCLLARNAMPLGCSLALPCRPELKHRKDTINLHIMWLTKTGMRVIAMFEQFNMHTKRVGCDASFQKDFAIEKMASQLVKNNKNLSSKEVGAKLQSLDEETAIKVVTVMNILQKIPQMSRV